VGLHPPLRKVGFSLSNAIPDGWFNLCRKFNIPFCSNVLFQKHRWSDFWCFCLCEALQPLQANTYMTYI